MLALQVAQQLEHLALHGHVERGRRLVGDQHVGLEGQRHGDHDALAHAAGKLVRKLFRAGVSASEMRTAVSASTARWRASRPRQRRMRLDGLGQLPADRSAPD